MIAIAKTLTMALRPRKSFAFEKIHDRIQQVGDDSRHRQRPKHRRQNIQHVAQSPHEQNDEPHEHRNRQTGQQRSRTNAPANGWVAENS